MPRGAPFVMTVISLTFLRKNDIFYYSKALKVRKRGQDMERMPHIGLPSDLGIEYAILPGDPARVDKIASYLDNVEDLGFNREYKSVCGTYKGVKVLAMSTGMGGTSTAIGVEELARIGVKVAIRVGSCGAMQPEIHLGDLILVNGAVRQDGTSKGYAPVEYPAIQILNYYRLVLNLQKN